MPKLPVISAKTLINVLIQKLDFKIVHQRGSHIKLRRYFNNRQQTLIIPNHKIIRKGTLRNILRELDFRKEEFEELMGV